jgi:CheY-like chemotaxis protein
MMAALVIFLVEDNEDDRFLTIRTLKKLPLELEITIAKNGDEALKALLVEGKKLPDLVLLDLQLPKLGGTALLTRLRNRYDNSQLPVVVLTSSDNPADINTCLELGICGYLSKPLDPLSLGSFLGRQAGNS